MADAPREARTTTLYVNGRFLTQTLSGVQRFANEITAAIGQLYGERLVVLTPPGAVGGRAVGRLRGQAWEQCELPGYVSDGILLNLGNTAPLRLYRQVVVIHDAGVFATPEAYSWRLRAWYKFVHRRLLRSGARIVTVSQFARAELCRHLGARPDQIAVISEGGNHMQTIIAEPEILEHLPSERFVLVVGNLAAHKNLPALSGLVAALVRRGVTLVITGGLAAGTFRQVRPDALPRPAHYTGRISDGALKALYGAAICLVLPSRYEGFGLPALEAMACDCPVVTSRIPALEETCADAAVYFNPLDPSDIAAQVCRVVDDPDLRAGLLVAARIRVATFTWSRAARELVGIAEGYVSGLAGDAF